MLKKHFGAFKDTIKKLFSLKDTPHAIAGGVAIGIFMGFTPLFGFKTLLSLGFAYLLRCNPVAAVIAVSLHDVFILFVPFLLRMEYDLGYWLLSNPHTLPQKFSANRMLEGLHWDFRHWKNFLRYGPPVLLGSLFLSTPTAIISYYLSLGIVKRVQARRAQHEADKEK